MEHLDRLAVAFHETGRGLLVGVGLTCAAQGLVAMIAYLALGVPQGWVLGPITGITSIIPVLGSAMIWGPVAVGLFLTDQPIKTSKTRGPPWWVERSGAPCCRSRRPRARRRIRSSRGVRLLPAQRIRGLRRRTGAGYSSPSPSMTVQEDDNDNSLSGDDHEDIAHHPHDGLVKRIFTDPETAAVELRQVLPAALCDRLDWGTLRVEPSSFIDPKLKPRHSDILYTVATTGSKRRISLYTVLEHQSKPDATMAARFIVYVGRLYERYIRQHKNSTTVPMVVPILLYQGPTGWTLPRRLSESLDVPPELLAVFPSPIELVFAVDDLEESVIGEQVTRDMLVRDRHLAQAEMARTMLWLYHHQDASAGERAAALGLLLEFIAETWGPDAVRPFLTYLLSAFPTRTPIRAIIERSLNPETLHLYATIRDELIAEGMLKGEAKGEARGEARGMAKGMAEMLEQLLDSRELALTDELRERVAGCMDESLLRRWFQRAITAANVTDVFDD